MKIKLDPLKVLRDAAEGCINQHFNHLAQNNLHKDHAHRLKKVEAEKVIAGAQSSVIAEEALLLSVPEKQLAELILSKPDGLSQREMIRRRAILCVRDATSPAELNNVLGQFGIQRLEA